MKIKQILIDNKVAYSMKYTDVADADKWYQQQMKKKNFIPIAHTVQDIDDPDYIPEWEQARVAEYEKIKNTQLELLVDAIVYGKTSAKLELKTIIDDIKTRIPKPQGVVK